MSPIAVNLVAVSVFLVTITSLLGSALGLPPSVPASVVIVALALATADRFLWSGRGGVLAIDWFAQRNAGHRDRVLHHEAGHILVAYLSGLTVTSYALSAWEALRQGQPGQGGVRFDDQPLQACLATGELPATLLAAYTTTLMAGIAAEQVIYGEAQGGDDDRQQLRTLLRQLTASNPGRLPDYATQRGLSLQRAKSLIQENRAALLALVEVMRSRGDMAACRAAIDQARPAA